MPVPQAAMSYTWGFECVLVVELEVSRRAPPDTLEKLETRRYEEHAFGDEDPCAQLVFCWKLGTLG